MLIRHRFISNSIALSLLTLFVPAVYGQQVQPDDDRLKNDGPNISRTVEIQPTQAIAKLNSTKSKVLTISKEELVKHPDLIVRALIPAVMQNNVEAVEQLFPLYQKQKNIEHNLVLWSGAILEASKHNYSKAINLYRELISINPEIIPIRFQLAQALYQNYDNEAAIDQFTKLRSEKLSPQSYQLIDNYITALRQRESWSFNGGMNYIQDNNVNNAPGDDASIGDWKGWQSESAKGLLYNFGATKKWEIQNGYFSQLDLDMYGRYYWDNKKYNEMELRGGFGVGYHTARFETLFMPFTNKRWYGGGSSGGASLKQYSQNSGARLDTFYWLTNQWKLSNLLEYSEIRYKTRKHLNGNNYFTDIGLIYIPQSIQYWFTGINYYRSNARDKDEGFNRFGIRIGWGQEWGFGLSTRLSFNYAYRKYFAPGRMLAEKQVNREYSPQLTIWHRNIEFFGITPQVTWVYNKVISNNPFYSYDKHNIYIEFSKRF